MRKMPDMTAIKNALNNFDDAKRRHDLLKKAGQIHNYDPFYFQVAGEKPEIAAKALQALTDNGNVPEALRIAHLIGSAIAYGQSGKRA